MDILVALSQGAGLAVACGLVALLPLGVLALAGLIGWLPGGLSLAAETPFVIAAWIVGLIEAAARALLPVPVRIALSAVGGGTAFELAAGATLPFVGLAIGTIIGGGTAWTSTRLIDRAIAGGGPRWGVTATVAGAGIVAAALAIIPIVGFALVLVVIWATIRARKDDQERFAGLRVLR